MSISEVLFQNLMPKNFLDSSDDETEAWTTSSGSSNQSAESGDVLPQTTSKGQPNFHVFEDYFGLSNLLQNVRISEDNPFLYSGHSKHDVFYRSRNRRMSWESDTSDPNAVISPTLEAAPYSYSGLIGDYNQVPLQTPSDSTRHHHQQQQQYDCGFKQLPPPSMRLSKAMRDQIINGSYQQYPTTSHGHQQQQQFMSRRDDQKLLHQQVMSGQQQHRSHTSQIGGNQVSPLGGVAVNGNGGVSSMHSRAMQPQQQQVCVFCRNNGESEAVYSSHVLKDAEGRTACPILRAYTCPICKANGDNSHTIKYCPLNQHSNNNGNRNNSTSGNLTGMQMPPPQSHAGLSQQQAIPSHMTTSSSVPGSCNNTAPLLRNNVAPVNRVVRPPFSSAMAQRMKPR